MMICSLYRHAHFPDELLIVFNLWCHIVDRFCNRRIKLSFSFSFRFSAFIIIILHIFSSFGTGKLIVNPCSVVVVVVHNVQTYSPLKQLQ